MFIYLWDTKRMGGSTEDYFTKISRLSCAAIGSCARKYLVCGFLFFFARSYVSLSYFHFDFFPSRRKSALGPGPRDKWPAPLSRPQSRSRRREKSARNRIWIRPRNPRACVRRSLTGAVRIQANLTCAHWRRRIIGRGEIRLFIVKHTRVGFFFSLS